MTTSRYNTFGYILIFIFSSIGTSIYAQEKGTVKYWKVELMGAVNTYDGWEIEPSVTYQPVRYIGLTMGLLFCNPINESGFIGESQDKQWYWSAVDDDNGSYLLPCALPSYSPHLLYGWARIKITPYLFHFSRNNHAFAPEPGIQYRVLPAKARSMDRL